MAIYKNNKRQINFNIPYKYYFKKNGSVRIKQTLKIPQNIIKYRKISKNEMLNLETGEVLQMKISENRGQNVKSLKKTISNIIDIIDYNFSTAQKDEILFLTLTYRENMQDTKKLYLDLNKFVKKIKYYLKEYGEFKYFMTVEPQERGSWHSHMILQVEGCEKLYISNEQISKWWGKGFTKTERPKGIKKLGVYLGCYLTDLIDEEGNKKKGQRLHLYPNGINIYRCSRNIKKPQYIEAIGDDVIDKKKLSYSIAYDVIEYKEELNELKLQNSTIFAEYE